MLYVFWLIMKALVMIICAAKFAMDMTIISTIWLRVRGGSEEREKMNISIKLSTALSVKETVMSETG